MSLWSRIYAWLKQWQQTAHEQTKAADHHQPPANCDEDKPPPIYSVRIEPSAKEDERYAQQRDFWRRQICLGKWQNWITATASLAALVGLALLWGTVRATRDTADAAQKSAGAVAAQVDIMKRQLELSERPWVSAKVDVESSLTYSVNGAGITVNIRLKNTGHSPALATGAYGRFLLSQEKHIDLAERDKLCKQARDRTDDPRYPGLVTVFPGDEVSRQAMFVSLPDELQDAINESRALERPAGSPDIIFPRIVLCVDYKFAFVTGHHQSAYIFHLNRRDPNNAWGRHTIEAMKVIPADELVLDEAELSTSYAD